MGAFAPARLLCLVKLGGLIKERIVAKLMSALCIRRGRFAYLSFGYAKTSSVDNVSCPRFFLCYSNGCDLVFVRSNKICYRNKAYKKSNLNM